MAQNGKSVTGTSYPMDSTVAKAQTDALRQRFGEKVTDVTTAGRQ